MVKHFLGVIFMSGELQKQNPHIRNLKTSRVEYSQGGIHDEKYQIPPCTDR